MSGVKVNAIEMIQYIDKHIIDLDIEESRNILRIICDSPIEDDKIIEKGAGTEIKYRNIPTVVLVKIYNYVESRINKKKNDTDTFPETDNN